MTEVSIPDGVFINWADTYPQSKLSSADISKILREHLQWLKDAGYEYK